MKAKRVNPIEGVFNFLEVLKTGNPYPDKQITDELDGRITVDSALAKDTGLWETGIERLNLEGKWVIVEQYPDEDEAKKGHLRWVELMKEYPDYPLRDIDLWNLNNEEE